MFTKKEKVILSCLPKGFKYIARDKDGALFVYKYKPKRLGNEFMCKYTNPPTEFVGIEIFDHMFKKVTFENSPIKFRGEVEVLDEAERSYLKGVFKPFRERIVYVKKKNQVGKLQYIFAKLEDNEWISLPRFEHETMYKGMKAGKEYSLSELGI